MLIIQQTYVQTEVTKENICTYTSNNIVVTCLHNVSYYIADRYLQFFVSKFLYCRYWLGQHVAYCRPNWTLWKRFGRHSDSSGQSRVVVHFGRPQSDAEYVLVITVVVLQTKRSNLNNFFIDTTSRSSPKQFTIYRVPKSINQMSIHFYWSNSY